MNEKVIRTINGYHLADADARESAKKNAEAIVSMNEEIADVFPNEAKSLLIEILQSSVFNEDVSEKINELAEMLGVAIDEMPEMMETILSMGSISYASDTLTGVYTNGAAMPWRASLLATKGDIPICNQTGEHSPYYLLKIPKNAIGVNVKATADFAFGVFVFSSDGTKYIQQVDSGWQDMESDTKLFELESRFSDGMHYFGINFKLKIEDNIDVDVYKDVISVEFVYNQ